MSELGKDRLRRTPSDATRGAGRETLTSASQRQLCPSLRARRVDYVACQSLRACPRVPVPWYVTGGDDWKTVKDEMEVGLEVLTQELARFEDMLKQAQPVGSEPT